MKALFDACSAGKASDYGGDTFNQTLGKAGKLRENCPRWTGDDSLKEVPNTFFYSRIIPWYIYRKSGNIIIDCV